MTTRLKFLGSSGKPKVHQGPLYFPARACRSTNSIPSEGHIIKPIFMKLGIVQCHANSKIRAVITEFKNSVLPNRVKQT